MSNHDLNRAEMLQVISDLHKDVYGFRPRGMGYSEMSDADLSAEFQNLLDNLEVVMADDARREAAAIAKFEANIASVIASGAGDRATAIRWFRDANRDDWMGDDSLRYDLGLPWNFDFDHGDCDFFVRQAAEKNAARAREFEIECLQDAAA